MFLIVGLGNPGSEYEDTRHNIGFKFVDYLAQKYNASWQTKSKFYGLVTESVNIDGLNVIMCKPQTYMNLSGKSVQALATFYKITPENIIVLHDEIDLPLAKIMYKFAGGSAGHNGIKSIIQHIGADFHRVRIGVDRPSHPNHPVSSYVLEKFSNQELTELQFKMHDIDDNIQLIMHKKTNNIKKTW